MRSLLAVMRREWWVHARAYRFSFFAGVLLSAAFTVLMGRVLLVSMFHGRVSPRFVELTGTADYMTWLTAGVVSGAFAHRLLYPVRNHLEEQREGTLPALRLTGIPLLHYQAGCVGFSAAYALVEAAIIVLVVAPWSGATIASLDVAALAAAYVAGVFGLLGLSTLLSAIVLRVGDRLVVESVAFSLQSLVSGVAFPTEVLPLPLQWLAEALPLTWVLRLVRGGLIDGADASEILRGTAALGLIGLAHGAAGLVLLRPTLRRALEASA